MRILPSAVGGGFGTKLDLSVQPLLGLAALATGRPVRMAFTRPESMRATTKRHPSRITARLGCDAQGRLTALAFEGVFDTGAYASWGPTVANRVPVHATGPYRVPAVHATARAVHTHGPVAGAFRGFGVPQAAIATETLIDRLADAAGIDPLAFRLAERAARRRLHRHRPAARLDRPRRLPRGPRPALARGPRRRRGPQRRPPDHPPRRRPRRRLVRLRQHRAAEPLDHPHRPRPDGAVVLHLGAIDIGQGSATVIPQIAADALGLPLAAFRFVDADTARTPDAGKTSASRQTVVSGRAAEAAAGALRAAILRHANAGPDARFALAPGRLEVSGARSIDLAALPRDLSGYVFAAEATWDPPTTALDADGQGIPYAVYGTGAQIAELEVDTRLGTVRLTRVTAAHDLGRAINPTLAEGQIEGGIAMGLGMALMEEYLPDRPNLHDYLIPTIGDVPEIEPILIEKPDPEGPAGARGLGEHTLIPTAPAILNAIRHATGAEITRLPALPHRVLAAIRATEPRR